VVVSPFLDRQHGTETCVIEQIERLAKLNSWEIHLYSQKVEDVRNVQTDPPTANNAKNAIRWHKISSIPGPHLLQYLWWFVVNQRQRRRELRSGKAQPDLVYAPGINCLDADVIVVHIVFHEFYERVKNELTLCRTSPLNWPRVIHRRLYYKLIMALEQKVYRDNSVRLIAVSNLLAKHLKSHFGRTDVTVIPNAVDTEKFTDSERAARRSATRQSLNYTEDEFVVLLIGNDWKNKGLDALLKAAALLRDLPLRLLVVGSDDPSLFRSGVEKLELENRVRFEPPSRDVLRFYAAADLYSGPSLEDSFGLPILEAMACGLPVIASARAGSSELVCDGETGRILRDPQDHNQLAQLIRRVYENKEHARTMGEAAARSAKEYFSWDQNAAMTQHVLEEAALRQK
jgi:glycosyltransferase involved in cell wall biosynthesis